MKGPSNLVKLMKFSPFLMFCFLLQQSKCSAQPLNRDLKDGGSPVNWNRGKDIVFKEFPKEYSKETKKLLDSMAIWTARSFGTLSGFATPASSIEWHAIYLPKPVNRPIAAYQLKATIPVGTGAGLLTISANDLSMFGQPFLLNGNTRSLLEAVERKDSGVYSTSWQYAHPDRGGKTSLVKAWLICFTDSLPYVVVDRREYFEEAIKELETAKDSVKWEIRLEMPGKNAQAEEAYRKNELREIANSFTGNDRLQRERDFWIIYKPDSVFQEDTLNSRAAVIIEKTKLIKHLLESLKELSKPAFVSAPAVAFEGLEDGLPGARILARPRPDYFRRSVPPERPQFLVVTWQYDSEDVAAADLGEVIGKELDLTALRDILRQVRPFYSAVKKK
jgi:hypothetical protein